eukprot:c9585_g3_i1.p1 GENE.c9585_g3_i1~~c9585_g3_i1.p1  ORF type:complete len:1293 (+),score=353.32 c9585_g3_i1:27-3905(+)
MSAQQKTTPHLQHVPGQKVQKPPQLQQQHQQFHQLAQQGPQTSQPTQSPVPQSHPQPGHPHQVHPSPYGNTQFMPQHAHPAHPQATSYPPRSPQPLISQAPSRAPQPEPTSRPYQPNQPLRPTQPPPGAVPHRNPLPLSRPGLPQPGSPPTPTTSQPSPHSQAALRAQASGALQSQSQTQIPVTPGPPSILSSLITMTSYKAQPQEEQMYNALTFDTNPHPRPHLDDSYVVKERNQFLQNQIRARQQWLRQQIASATLSSESKQKLIIEEKQLTLIQLQSKVRSDVLVRLSHFALSRGESRKAKRLAKEEAKENERLERLLQGEGFKPKGKQSQYLEAIKNVCTSFKEFHQNRAKELNRLNRAVLAHHREKERKRRADEDRLRRERLKALRENNEDAYFALVQHTKNERLTQLLAQTEEYLAQIGAKVQQERERINQFKSVAELENEREWAEKDDKHTEQVKDMASNAVSSGAGDDHSSRVVSQYLKQKREYYTFAHRIQERIIEQPKAVVGGALKPYQIEGLQWLISLYNNGLNGILADEMGLGKTIQTISMLAYLIEKKHNTGPFLIVVPLSTLSNWQIELGKWAPSIIAVSFRGTKDSLKKIEKTKLADNSQFNCVLTTYEMILKSSFLRKKQWQLIIVDEGHRLKNADCKLFRILANFKSRHRLLLTGTPLQNSLDELWALLNFLLPTIFNSCDNFEDWFNAPFQDKAVSQSEKIDMEEEEVLLVINRLHQVLRPFLLRREKKDVESQLPEKKEHVIRCHISAWQRVLYDQIQNKAARLIDPKNQKFRSTIANTLIQLRKVCNHPFLITDNNGNYSLDELIRSSGKFELLNRILPKLLQTGHKVLIFSQMTRLLDLLEIFLSTNTICYCRLDGSTKPDERGAVVANFTNPNSPINVFLLSTRAGGLGLNLQAADTVILYDSDWNPQQDLQAQDRAHRIGQKSEVRVFRFVTATPVEESMYMRAMAKLDMDAKIIQAGKFNNNYTEEDRQEYLTLLLRERADEVSEAEVPDSTQLNELIARSAHEFDLFERIDMEAEEALRAKANAEGRPVPSRLMVQDELPEWLTQYVPSNTDFTEEEQVMVVGKRKRAAVTYDDGLSERQFGKLLESGMLENDAGGEGLNAHGLKQLHRKRKQQRDEIDTTAPPQPPPVSATVVTANASKSVAPPEPAKPVDLAWLTNAIHVFNAVYEAEDDTGRKVRDIFVKLPSKKELPDYYVIIQHPMDLRHINKQIAKQKYVHPREFVRDMRLVCSNAQKYNREDSQIYADSLVLSRTLEAKLKIFFPQYCAQ